MTVSEDRQGPGPEVGCSKRASQFTAPSLVGRTWTQKLNDEFIDTMKKEGREIHDIGPDFARRAKGVSPSAVYGTERKALDGYGNYTGWHDRSQGGVPGFD